MTAVKSKYQIWAVSLGLPFFTIYLFQDVLYQKLWVLSYILLLLLGFSFFVVAMVGVIKKDVPTRTILIFSVLTIAVTETLKLEVFKSEKILEATLSDELSAIKLTLRKNRSFQVTSISMVSEEVFKGKYEISGGKIVFLDKPYDNHFIPDTVTIIGDKIILRVDKNGQPITDFGAFFSIKQNNLQTTDNTSLPIYRQTTDH